MKSARIAMISYHTCPLMSPGEGKIGGMNVYVRELTRHLGDLGLHIDVFTRAHHGQELDDTINNDNIRVVHVDSGTHDSNLESLYRQVDQFEENIRLFQENESIEYQLVHSHYWLSGLVGRSLTQSWRVPHILTFHTLSDLKRGAGIRDYEPEYRARLETELMKSADLVIVSSVHEHDAMVFRFGAPRERIEAVPCGVDLSVFGPTDMSDARKRLGLNGEKVMLYVGRIEPSKGVEFLLHIAAMMGDSDSFRFLIVGGDPDQEEELNRLKVLSEDMGIDNVVKFVGRVDQDLLPSYYSAADVCVIPSYYESFGLVALESLACGTPVIASRVGGLSTVVKHGQTGYLMPWRCPEIFADTLEMILNNGDLRSRMGEAGIKIALELSWDKVSRVVHDLYESSIMSYPREDS